MALSLAGVAFVAAIISGVAGIGGGTLLIAAMYAVGLTPLVAVPLHATVQLASNFSRTVAYARDVDVRAALWFMVASAPMPFLVARWVAQADPDVVRLLLATFVLLSLVPSARRRLDWSLRRRMLFAGVLNGGVGMVVGATGLIIAPFFVNERWRKETTVGTLALCQSFGHLLKIAAFSTVGFDLAGHWSMLWPMVVAVVAGTFLGRALMQRIAPRTFVLAFRGLMLVLGLRLAYSGLAGILSGET